MWDTCQVTGILQCDGKVREMGARHKEGWRALINIRITLTQMNVYNDIGDTPTQITVNKNMRDTLTQITLNKHIRDAKAQINVNKYTDTQRQITVNENTRDTQAQITANKNMRYIDTHNCGFKYKRYTNKDNYFGEKESNKHTKTKTLHEEV